MNKISIIIRREYFSRVKKKSFLIMTILGPILMASIWIIPIYLATTSDEKRVIQVLDETGLFKNQFKNTSKLIFLPVSEDIEIAKSRLSASGDYALLYIPKTQLNVPTTAILYSGHQPTVEVQSHISTIMQKEIESLKLKASGVDPEIVKSIKTNINLSTIKIDENGAESKSFTQVSMVLGIFSGILIYFFIFMYGAQVMRGVIEEKTSRIIEVIISSVKPFELMMGKIVGIAMVGLTQFLLWIFLTLSIVTVFQLSMGGSAKLTKKDKMFSAREKILNADQLAEFSEKYNEEEDVLAQVIEAISAPNYALIVGSFLFYFLGGYLLYAAMFAAIGSAVDSEADTQQFMLPVTIPLILSIVMAQFAISNPDGPVAFWFSVIPFTSPVIMMVRIPFGVPPEELALSMTLLVAAFLGTTWMAAKIYRTGILMYGKKVNYAELWKWLRYRQ